MTIVRIFNSETICIGCKLTDPKQSENFNYLLLFYRFIDEFKHKVGWVGGKEQFDKEQIGVKEPYPVSN